MPTASKCFLPSGLENRREVPYGRFARADFHESFDAMGLLGKRHELLCLHPQVAQSHPQSALPCQRLNPLDRFPCQLLLRTGFGTEQGGYLRQSLLSGRQQEPKYVWQ